MILPDLGDIEAKIRKRWREASMPEMLADLRERVEELERSRRLDKAERDFLAEARENWERVAPHAVPEEVRAELLRDEAIHADRPITCAFGVFRYNTKTGNFLKRK
jgi:hypothetical protein